MRSIVRARRVRGSALREQDASAMTPFDRHREDRLFGSFGFGFFRN